MFEIIYALRDGEKIEYTREELIDELIEYCVGTIAECSEYGKGRSDIYYNLKIAQIVYSFGIEITNDEFDEIERTVVSFINED